MTTATADRARAAFFAAARSLNEYAEAGCLWDRPAAGEGGSDRPGDDFNRRATWDEVLRPHGWEPVLDRGGKVLWRRPGKAGRVWSATTGYCKSEQGELLYVFSTGAAPFHAEKSYSKFAAHALLNHGGDYKAAARALAGQGYGTPQRNGNGRHPLAGAARRPGPAGDAAEPEEDRAAFKALLPDEEPDLPLPQADPWPAPPAPQAYHGLAGDVVRLVEPQTEADPVAVLAQLLVMFGNAIGRKAFWPVEADRHFGNLFAVLVGETAVGRKGVSKGRALSAFAQVEGWGPQNIGTGLSSGEGLIWAVRDPVYKVHHVKQRGRVVDTQNVLEDHGIADKRLLVIEPEFAAPLRVMQREGNTLSPRLREAWDDGNLRSMTKNSQARATGAHISLLAHVTRPELVETSDKVSGTNGLYNRMLWLAVRRSKSLPLGGAPVHLGEQARRLAEAVRHGQQADLVWMTDGASALWCGGLYDRLSGLASPVLNRAAAQVRRLAMLYALLDLQSDVDVPHLEAAVALWDYCERSARWIFGAETGNGLADELLLILRAAGERGMSQNDIYDYFGRHLRAAAIGKALAALLEGEAVRFEAVQTKGRPSKRWFARGPERFGPCAKSAKSEESAGPTT